MWHDDENEKPVTANVVNCDWTAIDRPTSVCLRSILPLLTVVVIITFYKEGGCFYLLSVFLFVCPLDYSKSYGWILVNFL